MNRLEIAVQLFSCLARLNPDHCSWSDDDAGCCERIDRCLVLADMFIRRNNETIPKRAWDGPKCALSELTLDMVCQHSDWRAGDFITCIKIVREITGASLVDAKNWCDARRRGFGC